MLYYFWGLSQTDDRASYTRLMLHEMYTTKQIEVTFVGASPVYRGIDPAVSDEMLDRTTFNLGSSSQTLEDSYYLLKEALRTHADSIKTVIFHVSYNSFTSEESLQASMILIRYFKPSINRQLFANTVLGNPFFSTPVSMHAYGYDSETTEHLKNLEFKLTDPLYKSYDYTYSISEYEQYAGKGYVASSIFIPNGMMSVSDSPLNIEEETQAEEYAKKLIELCQQKGIRIILVSVPYSDTRLLALGESYDAGHAYIAGIAEEYDVPYWDFNLTDSAYFPGDDSCFKDSQHLNQKGAKRFTELLCRVLLDYEAGRDVSGYFCSSARQRILQTDTVRAIMLQANSSQDKGMVTITAVPLADPEIEVEYRFELLKADELIDSTEYGPIQSYTTTTPVDDLRIVCYARRKGVHVVYDAMQSALVLNILQEGA